MTNTDRDKNPAADLAAVGEATNGLTYRKAGVDIAAGNALVKAIAPLAAATKRPGTTADLGGFGGAFDLGACGIEDPVLIAATDGVGTKLNVAFATGQHGTIGIDLVAMCVNDIIVQGATPLFFLDYFATGALETDVAAQVIAGIAEGCKQAGCALIGGETAEMPGLYAPGHYDLGGFSVGAAQRGTLLPRDNIAAGDVLLGLPSSGLHSNGFSLVRRIVELSGLDWQDDAPFTPDIALGEALLTPTVIYVKAMADAIAATGAIKGLAHITGGGLTENLPRMMPADTIAELDLTRLPKREVFGWLAKTGGVATPEMLLTFNCGIGMVAAVAVEDETLVTEALGRAGQDVVRLGTLVAGGGAPEVRYLNSVWWE